MERHRRTPARCRRAAAQTADSSGERRAGTLAGAGGRQVTAEGCILGNDPARSEVRAMADRVAAVVPPGKAQIEACPECQGVAGADCYECQGAGKLLGRACPLCGDIAWDYVNGQDDRDGMACRTSCG